MNKYEYKLLTTEGEEIHASVKCEHAYQAQIFAVQDNIGTKAFESLDQLQRVKAFNVCYIQDMVRSDADKYLDSLNLVYNKLHNEKN
jgi:uncharacterized alkaline shock family protein YloU